MYRNQYGPAIDKSKVDLIAARARRLGFRRQDIEDAQQQIVLVLMDFRFDAAKSNGATEKTVITAIIDRQLLAIRRSRRRYASHVAGSEHIPLDVADATDSKTSQRQFAMMVDLEKARTHLSSEAREICDSLAGGSSLNAIAEQMGLSWHTVRRQVVQIRQCFVRLGIDATIG